MLDVPGYSRLTRLTETETSRLYRGERIADGLPVIIKVPRVNRP